MYSIMASSTIKGHEGYQRRVFNLRVFCIRKFALFSFLSLLLPTSLLAQELLVQNDSFFAPHASTEGILTAERHIKNKEYIKAEILIDAILDRYPQNILALMIKANIKLLTNHPEEADNILRRMEKSFPNRNDVKLSLAKIAFKRGEDRRAKRYALVVKNAFLAQETTTAAERDLLLEAEALLVEIHKHRKFRSSIKISTLHDTNINNGTEADSLSVFFGPIPIIVPVSPEMEPRGGLRIQIEPKFSIFYPLSRNENRPEWSLFSNFGAQFSYYGEETFDAYNARNLTADVGAMLTLENASMAFFINEQNYVIGGEKLLKRRISHANYHHLLKAGTGKISFTGRVSLGDHEFFRENNRSHDSSSLRAGFHYARPNNSAYQLRIGRTKAEAEAAWESHTQNLIYFDYTRFVHSLATEGAISYQKIQTDYAEENPFFMVSRSDAEQNITLSLQKKNWILLGSAPKISIRFFDRDSTISLYETQKQEIGISWERQF